MLRLLMRLALPRFNVPRSSLSLERTQVQRVHTPGDRHHQRTVSRANENYQSISKGKLKKFQKKMKKINMI